MEFGSRFLAGAGLAVALLASSPAHAEEFPTRTVRLVCPSVPGGGIDILARALAEDLGKIWKQAIVVDNRAGANGVLATNATVGAPPDGYTLLIVADNMLVANRFSVLKLPYDPDKSFSPISLLAQGDQLLVINESLPIRNFKELLAYAKEHPTSLRYGQWGSGSSPALFFETLNRNAGTHILGVPYKGVAPVMQSLLSDDIQLAVISPMTAAGLLQSGKLKPLASASATRAQAYPDIPTTAELGMPELRAYIWFGLVGPAGMPPALVQKIEHDVRVTLKDPAFLERHATLRGWTVVASGPQGLTDAVKEQTPIVGAMMKAAGVEPQ